MTEQNFWIIGVILKIIGGVFAFLTALFAFLASLNNEKTEKTKAWFQKKWEVLSNSTWIQMPENIIKFIVNAERKISLFLLNLFRNQFLRKYIFLIPIILFNFAFVAYFEYVYLPIALVITILYLLETTARESIIGKLYNKLTHVFLKIIFLFTPILGGVILLLIIALNSNLFLATISISISIPCFIIFGITSIFFLENSFIFGELVKKEKNKYTFIGSSNLIIFINSSIGFSFLITYISFLIGSFISDQSYIPQTFQMLISNVILDGLTLFMTIKLLRWSIKKNTWVRIPMVIILDIIIAAILSCLALYLGLVYTEQQLTITEILYILIGKSPSGESFELGPLFWAMHTTFIPTLLYLLLIGIGYIGKLILTPIKWFLGKGQEHKSPLGLTSALFGLLATIFGLAGIATDGIDKHIEKTEKHQSI